MEFDLGDQSNKIITQMKVLGKPLFFLLNFWKLANLHKYLFLTNYQISGSINVIVSYAIE